MNYGIPKLENALISCSTLLFNQNEALNSMR